MAFSCACMIISSLLGAAWPAAARAQTAFAPARPAEPSTRTEVVLTIVGPGAQSTRGSLVPLLEEQLRRMSLSLEEQQPGDSLSQWAAGLARSKGVLLAVALDTKSAHGWRLVLVDAARGRAIERELPGGVEQDAASIEVVVSIVLSAATALRDGLEVASVAIAAVVGDEAEIEPKTTQQPVLHAPPSLQRSVILRGAIGADIALFPTAKTAKGVALALGVGWRTVEVRAFGTLFWSTPVRSKFGDFRLNRALIGLAAGPVFSSGAYALLPQGGVLVERLRRSGTQPAQGLLVGQATPLYRVGGLLELRLRRVLVRPFSLELVAGAAYLGRSVQFAVRGGETNPFIEIGPLMGFVQLGVDVAMD